MRPSQAMGEWVLRMTMGCEGLLVCALEAGWRSGTCRGFVVIYRDYRCVYNFIKISTDVHILFWRA